MKKFLLSVAVLAVLGTTVEAAGKKGGNNGGGGNGGGQPINKSVQVVKQNNVNVQALNLNGNKFGGLNGQQQFNKVNLQNNSLKFATKGSFGYCFKGFNQCHWTNSCYLKQCGCYCNWCPTTCCYYYFCVPDQCWYPVSYCPYGKFVW